MIFPIKQIPMGHSVLSQNVEMTEDQVSDGQIHGKVACRAEIDRLTFQIFGRLEFACSVAVACARCTEIFEQSISGTFSVVLKDKASTERTLDGDEDSVDCFFSEEDDEVDLRQMVYEEIVIATPMMPLCSPHCSIPATPETARAENTNDMTVDPRWEALKKLQREAGA
jgi:uncharacterized metal-binding protein YceD (DUF177 family)